MLTIEASENPSRGIVAVDEAGNRHEIVHIACSIRPTTGVYLNIDVLDAATVRDNYAGVQAQITDFTREVFQRAASMGLPVPAVGDAHA